jgi:hypothetical protein
VTGLTSARPLTAFRVLVAGNMVSAFGSYLNMVALNFFVYQATGSAWQAGLFMALRLASGFAACTWSPTRPGWIRSGCVTGW